MPDTDLSPSIIRYQAACAIPWTDAVPVEAVRFVVLDCETTGFDARRDRIVSVGAVAVKAGNIDLGDGIELLLRVRHNTAATLVHGITRAETREALHEPEALARLLDYLGNGVIVGHHINHDIAMLDAALIRHGGDGLCNRRLDTGLLAARLIDAGAFAHRPPPLPPPALALDDLCAYFNIIPHDRHTAAGDAFLTAQVFLRLLRIAAGQGWRCLSALLESQGGVREGVD